jgi:hypothetical protein
VRRGRLVACVCLLGLFVAALVTSLDYSLIDTLGPGPGFFPFWLSLIGSALTLAILVETARSPDTSFDVVPRPRSSSGLRPPKGDTPSEAYAGGFGSQAGAGSRGGPNNPGIEGEPPRGHTPQPPPGVLGRPVEPGDDKQSHRHAALQAGSVLVALGAAALLIEPLGFRLTMLAFIAGLLAALGARSPAAILITALAGSFGVFHVF